MLMRTSALLDLSTSALQHTLDHVDCPACEADRLALARSSQLRVLKFRDAALVCLDNELRLKSIKPRTHKDHCDFVRRLNGFFAEIPLEKVHEGHVLNYQKLRARTAGAELINHEVAYLAHVLTEAGLWAELKPKVTRLMVPKSDAGRALEPEEQERLKLCAASNPRWQVAYWATLLTLNLGVGPGEISRLRVQDLDVREGFIDIRVDEETGKNPYREESYPMNDTVRWVSNKLLKRYFAICERQGIEPSGHHFVLPYLPASNHHSPEQIRQGYDPTRPQASWRSAWRSLTAKAGLPVRIYDLRHTFSTGIQEDTELSADVVQKLMRHGTKTMKRRYLHLRDQVLLKAVTRHESTPAPMMVEGAAGPVAVPVLVKKGA